MDKIFLTNTDTAIGFVSKNKKALDRAKKRPSGKKYIKALPNCKSIEKRVHKKFRKAVRRAAKITFIISSDYSFRVIKNCRHSLLINRLGWAYTTSANVSNKSYSYNFAYSKADIVVYPLKEQNRASKIYKLGKRKVKRIR